MSSYTHKALLEHIESSACGLQLSKYPPLRQESAVVKPGRLRQTSADRSKPVLRFFGSGHQLRRIQQRHQRTNGALSDGVPAAFLPFFWCSCLCSSFHQIVTQPLFLVGIDHFWLLVCQRRTCLRILAWTLTGSETKRSGNYDSETNRGPWVGTMARIIPFDVAAKGLELYDQVV